MVDISIKDDKLAAIGRSGDLVEVSVKLASFKTSVEL
jgi:hypothetical protein